MQFPPPGRRGNPRCAPAAPPFPARVPPPAGQSGRKWFSPPGILPASPRHRASLLPAAWFPDKNCPPPAAAAASPGRKRWPYPTAGTPPSPFHCSARRTGPGLPTGCSTLPAPAAGESALPRCSPRTRRRWSRSPGLPSGTSPSASETPPARLPVPQMLHRAAPGPGFHRSRRPRRPGPHPRRGCPRSPPLPGRLPQCFPAFLRLRFSESPWNGSPGFPLPVRRCRRHTTLLRRCTCCCRSAERPGCCRRCLRRNRRFPPAHLRNFHSAESPPAPPGRRCRRHSHTGSGHSPDSGIPGSLNGRCRTGSWSRRRFPPDPIPDPGEIRFQSCRRYRRHGSRFPPLPH